MKRRTKVTQSQKSLYHRILDKLRIYYPWLLVTAIAYLFLFPSSLLVADSSKPETRVKTIVKETKVNYSKYPKILVFVADKSNRGKGKLVAVNTKKGKIDGAWNALSGVGGREDQRRLGPIPSQPSVNVTRYMVSVRPLTLSNPGIAGKFYKINPHTITINGKSRGDFGIHADRNVPGTAGCIGIPDGPEWQGFKKLMSEYDQAGLTQIPLLVSYR